MIASSSPERKPIEITLNRPGPDYSLEGDHLSGLGMDVTVHPEKARHRVAPYVRVEKAHDQAPPGESGRQVHAYRRLADTALTRCDRKNLCPGWDIGRNGAVLGFQSSPRHELGPFGRRPSRQCEQRRSRHQGIELTCRSTSVLSWSRSGQEAIVSATSTLTALPLISMPRTMPSSTMSVPSSGSITPARAARTASSLIGKASGRPPASGGEEPALFSFRGSIGVVTVLSRLTGHNGGLLSSWAPRYLDKRRLR